VSHPADSNPSADITDRDRTSSDVTEPLSDARRRGIRTTDQPGLLTSAPERFQLRVGRVRAPDSDDRPGQRRECSHL